jgi:hypothetical protein
MQAIGAWSGQTLRNLDSFPLRWRIGSPHYRANSRNFRRAVASKQLTNGLRQFEASFWLPSLDTFRTFAGQLAL